MIEKTCPKCGDSKPLSEFLKDKSKTDGAASCCRECNKKRCRERYQNNKVSHSEKSEEWYLAHKEERRLYMQEYNRVNGDKLRARAREYYQNNKVRQNKLMAEYAEANQEQIADYQREYRAQNAEKIRQQAKSRIASRSAYVKEKSEKQRRDAYRKLRESILETLGGKCYCCEIADIRFLTIDHVNNDGMSERKPNGKQRNSYMILRGIWGKIQSLDDPLTYYRAACFNCNCARQYSPNKICPHQL
jgi:hypothetical protein